MTREIKMDVLLCIVYNGRNYHCCDKIFMGKRDIIIQLIIDEYIIYRKYIKKFENFLNADRGTIINGKWPKWKENKSEGFVWVDEEEIVYVEINNDTIEVYENDKIIFHKKIINPRNQKFIEFVNRRFLLKHICNKYNVPKDIHLHLINFF